MSKNFLFVNANSDYEEATAYETSDYISVSAGAADAGKPIVLDAGGQIDASMIDDSDIDHGSIGGLGDDDHTQYILVAGTRAFTGDQSMGGNQLTSVGDPTNSTIDGASNDAVPMSFLASTAANEGASVIGIEDAAAYFVANNVEDALAELYQAITLGGNNYTVGAGGVTAGDAVYVSANNTVLPLAVAQNKFVVGVALTTEAAAATVSVAKNDVILPGVLVGATAGDKYFWTDSGLSTTAPVGAGEHVWFIGVAKNATDLHIDVEFIKRNKV